jgi:GH25 family lysozyme M1 (1,4-beta-N-acetylmuramidase)
MIAALGLLFSRYQYQDEPLLSQIDPTPVTVVGNYLVFRMPADGDKRWLAWLREKGLDGPHRDERIVPLPTGGVFGEAVLGRYNSAEKIDLTRFWNWQDSPIPILPTEIDAPSLASRAQGQDLTPGQYAAPMVNIVAPAPLPTPTGMQNVLAALQSGSMFRDMSGLAATVGLAQAALTAANEAAGNAGKQAGANLKTGADLVQALLPMIAALATGSPIPLAALAPGKSSVSAAGGALNQAAKVDKAAGAGSSSGGSGSNGAKAPSSNGAGPRGDVSGGYTDQAMASLLGTDTAGPGGTAGRMLGSMLEGATAGNGSSNGTAAGTMPVVEGPVQGDGQLPDSPHGIDVSHFQWVVPWENLRNAGIDFTFIKATQGERVRDPRFLVHWALSQDAGLVRGAYHFFDQGPTGKSQAENFVRAIDAGGLGPGELAPVLDLERRKQSGWPGLHEDLAGRERAKTLDEIRAFLSTVESELGIAPMIYTDWGSWQDLLGDPQDFTRYGLWVARYWGPHRGDDLNPANRGMMLAPKLFGGWPAWTFFQFTQVGQLAGIKDKLGRPINVDRDIFNGTRDDLYRLAGFAFRGAGEEVNP